MLTQRRKDAKNIRDFEGLADSGESDPIRDNKELPEIITRYAAFEEKVRNLISHDCSPRCSSCTAVCCKPEFCREALDSPFLSMLRNAFPPAEDYRRKSGWLTETGCALRAGRPPICYEFLCQDIVETRETDAAKYVLSVLCRLVTHMGRFVSGRRHIVEWMDVEDCGAIRLSMFEKRLREAEAAFSIIRSFQRNGIVSDREWPVLFNILKLAESSKLKIAQR
jgi:hypothetical protein